MRSALLVASGNGWLRERASTLPFVRRAVKRFMPGERLEDAIAASVDLQRAGLGTVLTRLGENVMDAAAADETAQHYLAVCHEVSARALDSDISVKLTQLGLDIDAGRCRAHLFTLAEETKRRGLRFWIDMEQSAYVDRTLEMRRSLSGSPHVGVCLQAYLYRTADDVASLIPLGGGIRLVKGAYREPETVAFPRKADVDDNYFTLATRMLEQHANLLSVFGTHDQRLIDRIRGHADATQVPRDRFEFHLLFGIQRDTQMRLAREGHRVKVLISYGEQWFPWYMRRLAERPANLAFVAKSMLSR